MSIEKMPQGCDATDAERRYMAGNIKQIMAVVFTGNIAVAWLACSLCKNNYKQYKHFNVKILTFALPERKNQSYKTVKFFKIMIKEYIGERWQQVEFDFEYINDYRIEVSNFGRIRTFNKLSDGNIVNGSMINGYRIIRLKFYKARDPKIAKQLDLLQQQVFDFARKIKAMKQALAAIEKNKSEYANQQKEIEKSELLLKSLKKNLSKKFKDDLDGRVIHYHSLIHRLVAKYFCNKPSEAHDVVAHMDFEKLNNHYSNLVWMTTEENNIHREKSPLVIADKKGRKNSATKNSKVAKLTVTKVMLLKKLLNQGKPMRTLVKQFKVTETQIRRIKKGENWSDIEAVS